MAKDTLREVNAYNVDAVNNVAFMPKEEPKKETFFADGGRVETKKSKDKLEVANKYNLQKFNKKENLFFTGGDSNSRIDFANNSLYGTIPDKNSTAGSLGVIMNYNKQMNLGSSPTSFKTFDWNSLYPTQPSIPVQPLTTASQPKVVVVNQQALQTPVTDNSGKKNIPAASVPLATQLEDNQSRWDKLAVKAHTKNGTSWFDETSKVSMTDQYKNTKNWLGISKKDNPFSKGNIGGTMKTVGLAAASMADQVDTGDPRGLFDTLDPVYHLAGGRESAVGNAMSDTGVALTKSGVPIAMLAGAALKIVGGLTNAAFGIKEDKEAKKRADESINTNKNFMSNAGYYDDIKGPAPMTNTNVYEGGWFSQGKADDKNAALARQMADAYSWADRSVINNVRNISSDRLSDFLRNYSAFGGYLTRPKRRRKIKR